MTLEMEFEPIVRKHPDLDVDGLPPESTAIASTSLACSIGIMAYNEEGNIANAIQSVLGQDTMSGEISEVIVVASGCTDRTVDIARSLAEHEPRLRVITEEKRAGKASAINQFIRAAQTSVLVLVNADNIVRSGTIDALLRHFHEPTVGMVGGHPIPINDDDHFLGYAVHLLWRLHDQIARQSPKLGEIVAFRNVLGAIPTDTAVDELSMQAMISERGLRLVYEPQAVVYNRGPTTVVDFLRQRRRICAGHLRIARQHGYVASTMSTRTVGRAVLAADCFSTPSTQALWTVGAITLEATARALGYYDFLRHRSHHVWTAVSTTKGDLADDTGPAATQNVLLFHAVDFAENRLEMGSPRTRAMLRKATQEIENRLDPSAAVSAQANGTIVVVLAGERRAAEHAAHTILRDLATRPLDVARSDGRPLRLACAIVTFPDAGTPVAESVPALAS